MRLTAIPSTKYRAFFSFLGDRPLLVINSDNVRDSNNFT